MFRLRGRSQPENVATETQPRGQQVVDPTPDSMDDDDRLIAAAQQGDLPSFNALVVRHERAVYNLCYRMMQDGAAAEDATQDTFIKAWSAVGSFRGGLVRPWLLKIATNRCYDLLRAQSRRPAASLDAAVAVVETEPQWTSQTPAEHPEQYAARVELSAHLERALAALPDDQRLVIILSDIQGYEYDAIAAIAGIPIGTVKSRLSRARAKLRDDLRGDPAAREHFARFARLSDD
jgi:RNA polymerase sigma-70 factor (ECF subfamily)